MALFNGVCAEGVVCVHVLRLALAVRCSKLCFQQLRGRPVVLELLRFKPKTFTASLA